MANLRLTWITGLVVTALAAGLGAIGLTSCTSKAPSGTTAASDTARTGSPAPPLSADAKVARGKYLVNAIGCGDCHTPGSFYGAPDGMRMFAGSELGWTGPWGTTYAANITPDPTTGIATWSEDDIVKAMQKGVKPDGGPVLPPMPWPDLANLTPEDAHAIAAYLRTIPAVNHKVPATVPPGKTVKTAFVLPPPPAYDAPKSPPPVSAPAPGTAGR